MLINLPKERYLDYYLIVSKVEFEYIKLQGDFNGYIIKKKEQNEIENAKVVSYKNNETSNLWWLMIYLYAAIVNDIFGLPHVTLFERFYIQHSIVYKSKISTDWYNIFHNDISYIKTFIEQNLQCITIKSKVYTSEFKTPQKSFDKLYEIVQYDILLRNYYTFDIILYLQDIESKTIYCYKMFFDQYQKAIAGLTPKVLKNLKEWHEAKLSKKKFDEHNDT